MALRALVVAAVLVVHGVAAEARDVVFLLGTDAPGKAPFFAPAADYYRSHHVDAQTVASASSLAEVREYLVRHHAGSRWNRVTLVAHGAPWIGLDVPIFADGAFADLERLESAHVSGEFPPLPPGVIDAQTKLVVESCGLGRRPDTLRALANLLSAADGTRMQVSSPSGFVAFQSGNGDSRRFELAFAHAVVARRPNAKAAEAIDSTSSRLRTELGAQAVGAIEEVHPVHVTISRPATALPTRGKLRRTLQSDPVVRRRLASHGLTIDQLAWSLQPSATQAGEHWIEGHADMVVVREPLPSR